jgi:hypothetical protein
MEVTNFIVKCLIPSVNPNFDEKNQIRYWVNSFPFECINQILLEVNYAIHILDMDQME